MKAIIGIRTPAVENVKKMFLKGNLSRATAKDARDVTKRFRIVATIATIMELRKYLESPETDKALTKFSTIHLAGREKGAVSISKFVLNADIVSQRRGNNATREYKSNKAHLLIFATYPKGEIGLSFFLLSIRIISSSY